MTNTIDKKNIKYRSPVKHNNQLKDSDGREKAHRKQKEAKNPLENPQIFKPKSENWSSNTTEKKD